MQNIRLLDVTHPVFGGGMRGMVEGCHCAISGWSLLVYAGILEYLAPNSRVTNR